MMVLDVFYVAMATLAVMVVLQLVTFMITRMMYPPEPRVIYRDVPVMQQAPPPPAPMMPPPPAFPPLTPPTNQTLPALTQIKQEVQLPEYEPRKPASDALRLDPELPPGLQETRPPGT